MPNGFKKFFKKQTSKPVVINTVLFYGEYSPISKNETERIKKFFEENKEKYNKVNVGLITDHDDTLERDNLLGTDLSLEERQYICGKFFSLKLFPINFKKIIEDIKTNDSDKKEDIEAAYKYLTDNFGKEHILIVIRPEDVPSGIDKLDDTISIKDLNISFEVFESEPIKLEGVFKGVPVNSNSIKATCLLDTDKPEPMYMKTYCHQHGLGGFTDIARLIQLKCKNEKYDVLFKALFPDILAKESPSDKTVVMEMLKSIYASKNINNG